MNYNILRQRDFGQGLTDPALANRIRDDLTRDGWTLLTVDGSRAAQFEHTVLVTATGAEILTQV